MNSPFRELKKLLARRPAQREVSPTVVALADESQDGPMRGQDETALFLAAVAGVVPIPADERGPAAGPLPLRRPHPRNRDEAEALATLCDLVAGNAAFDVSDTDEHVEGMIVGLDPRIVRKLRAGHFASQNYLDLHGMTAGQAKTAVRAFLFRALRAGHRCVLLIHGRGRNSPGQRSVLKDGLKVWLTRGDLARIVLAFATARACDGGGGAMYILLRRDHRGKKVFRTLDGAKI